MRSRPGLGVRRRLVLGLVGLIAATALLVGGLSIVLLDRSMRSRLIADSVDTVEFALTSLAPAVGLPEDPDAATLRSTGLLDRFLTRGTEGVWVEFGEGERLSRGRVVPPEAVSDDLRRLVAGGDVGYEFTQGPDGSVLVTAARLPPSGPAFFFVDSTESVDGAVRRLTVVAGAVTLGVAVLGAVLSSRLAQRLLRPVAAAGNAAERMAGGDLDVRLPVLGTDELGRLAHSFNVMATSLGETIDELRRARERERRFVADVSHELKTPLTALVNAAAMLTGRLRKDAGATEDQLTLAEVVDRDVRRLRHLVDDLLEISRLESGATPPSLEPVDLAPLLASLAEQRHPDASLHVDGDGPVWTDAHSLERIVGNLLDNARRHAAGSPTDVSASVADDELVVEVADRGPGVDDDHLETLFDRFATPDPSRSSGTGLGLSIVAEHARRLGGSVRAAHRPGGGLTVTVSLPVGQPLHGRDTAAKDARDGVVDTDRGAQT